MPLVTAFRQYGAAPGYYWAELDGDGPRHGPFKFWQEAAAAASKAHPDQTTIFASVPIRFLDPPGEPTAEPAWSHATLRGDYDHF